MIGQGKKKRVIVGVCLRAWNNCLLAQFGDPGLKKMKRQWWDDTVKVGTSVPGRYLIINSTESAAQYMFEEWPGDRSTMAFQATVQALFDAHDGKLPIGAARAAFTTAVENAGLRFAAE